MKERFKSVDEFGVTTIEFAGFGGAFAALRLPFGRDPKSEFCTDDVSDSYPDVDRNISRVSLCVTDERDIELMSTLVRRGDEHSKVLRGIMVWCEINAPRYFHTELDTYRIGCERLGSESTMHIQGKGLPTEELVRLKENLTESTMQRRVWMFSYQTLRRVFIQRKNHRLPQWRYFCRWIKSLPYADELILAGLDDTSVELL